MLKKVACGQYREEIDSLETKYSQKRKRLAIDGEPFYEIRLTMLRADQSLQRWFVPDHQCRTLQHGDLLLAKIR